tara:strand:- start:295 stop:642 length:348 start_codon:yes stop_codon:yes gene_type:complete
MSSGKKNFKIVKIDADLKKSLSKKQQDDLMNKVFSNKDSYSASKKAANAIFKVVPKKKKMIKFILENQKPKKNGVKKQLAYNAYRQDEVKKVEISGKNLEFTTSPRVKACLKSDV